VRVKGRVQEVDSYCVAEVFSATDSGFVFRRVLICNAYLRRCAFFARRCVLLWVCFPPLPGRPERIWTPPQKRPGFRCAETVLAAGRNLE